MNERPWATAKWILAGTLLMSCLDGCSYLPRVPAAHSHDRAFIHYWRPPKGSNELRLAVKDNIDMQGVVTTAGSQYLAKNSPPASHDALCLAIARQRLRAALVVMTPIERALSLDECGPNQLGRELGRSRQSISRIRAMARHKAALALAA